MTYGVEALPLLREEVEDCPVTEAKLVLIDEFCELNDKNYNFVCYVKLYFTTEEIIVARRKIWKAQAPAFIFSRVHKIKDIVFKKEAYLTDIITVVDSSKDQKFYYQIHFSGDLKEWFIAFERFSQWHQNKRQKQNANTSAAAASNCNEVKMVNGGPRSSRVSSMVLWNRADCQFLNASTRSNSVSSSQDLSSHLVTPVRSSRLSNSFYKDAVLSGEEDVSSSPEPQESSGIDFEDMSINEEGDTSKEEVGKTFSTALEAWTPSSDEFVTASSYSNEAQVIPDDDKIRTLDTAVCNKGHSRNKSTSLTRGVQIVTRSDSTISSAASDPGGDPKQTGLAYANIPAVLKSISYDYRCSSSNSFLSSPLRHTQIRGKKVKFSPRQKTFSTLPRDDSSEQCLIFENGTQDDSFCSITPENSTPSDNNEDVTTTLRPLTPTRSVPTTKQERGASLVAHGSPFTLPKRKLVAKLFRRRTASSISDIDDSSNMDMESPETPRLTKKKLHQMDPKVVASQLVLLDAEMLRKIKPEELKGGAWVGKNKETRAPNVMKMVQDFNRLALLVPTEILEEKTASARAKVVACYIQIADKCRSLGNYNSLKAILAGLQCTPIYRLKKTWKEVSGRRKKKFEDLSHLMSEEDNWKVYKIELYDTMSKGTCVPFLGQFLTQILQQETVKEVISYRKKSHGRRPQSNELSSDNRETLSAPTTPVNSDDETLDASLAVSPTDLNLDFDQTTPTPYNVQPDVPNEETENKESELIQKEKGIKKESSGMSVVERRDTLSPLPIGKFKRNYLSPSNLYRESLKKSSAMHSSYIYGVKSENKDTVDESDKMVENGDTAGHKLEGANCEVVKTISMESLDSYDGASSCYSRSSTPARDVPNAPDSEVEETYSDNAVLDISQVEVNIEDSLDTPTSDFDKEGSPFASTPIEDITIESVSTSNEDNAVEEKTAANIEKSPMKDGKKKRKWSSLRRKSPPPEGSSQSVTNCTDESAHKKETRGLRRNLSSPLKSNSSSSCNDNATLKKEKGTPRRKQSSPARDSSPSCNDDAPRKKEKRGIRRRLSSPLRSHHSNPSCEDNPPQKRDKLHIYHHSDDVDGFNVNTMLQQMQFSSVRYMSSLDARPDIQSFIKGLQYNSEEDNYHMSIQTEPIEHNY